MTYLTYTEVTDLWKSFDRAADWLESGKLPANGESKMVGIADFRLAAQIIRNAAYLYAASTTEG